MTSLGTTANNVVEVTPNADMKYLFVEVLQPALNTGTGVNPGDTFTVDLASYGASVLWDHSGSVHTTLNSVIVAEQATIARAGTVYTFTIAGGDSGGHQTLGSSKTRVYRLLIQ